MNPASYPVPGETLGHYRVVRRVGFGGMGAVFEARDETLDRAVALKVISPHLAHDPDFRERFVREAQAQASVRSPHVVTVYAHGETEGRLYIATELIDSGDLGRLVRQHGAPPLPTGLDIIGQVATGLADAHEAGLVHRDIKPANVLLRWRSGAGGAVQAFLSDFGIARHVDVESGLTRSGATFGTPSYMAPELHTGGTAGHRSDIYSLGCLLWAALTGDAPYTGTSDYQIVTAHLEQPVPQLQGGSPAADLVNRVLRRSMAKRPDDRYTTAAEMSADLRETLALSSTTGATPRPVVAPGATSSPGGERPSRAPRIALVAAAAVLVLAAVAGGFLALAGGDEPEEASGSTSLSASDTASGSPSGDGGGAPGDGARGRAIASLERSLLEQETLAMVGDPEELAHCVATGWVDKVGLEAMADAGFFDDDWNYVDQPQESMTPEMRSELTSTVTRCTVDSGL